MSRLIRTLATIAATLAGLLAGTAFAAQSVGVDRAIAGHWAGQTDGIDATVSLTTRGLFSGTLSGRGFNGCTFAGSFHRNNLQISNATEFRATVRTTVEFCDATGFYSLSIVATPTTLTAEFNGEERGRALARFGLRLPRALRAGVGAVFVDPAIAGQWPAIAGHWQSERIIVGAVRDFSQVTLVLTTAGRISGTRQDGRGRGYGVDSCSFEGELYRARKITPSGVILAEGEILFPPTCVSRNHASRAPPGEFFRMYLTEDARSMIVQSNYLEVWGLSRTAPLGSANPVVTIDPQIAGHWRGGTDGISAIVDLTTDGNFSGTLSGGGKDGCMFRGVIEGEDMLQNTSSDFGAITGVEMSGCQDASPNGARVVVVTAAAGTRRNPGMLGFGFLNTDQADQFQFKVEGLQRTGPARP